MLTIFGTPKPFFGHISIIQHNALKSWTQLAPDVEIILFGDEAGTADACRELSISHHAEIQRNEYGTPLLDYVFRAAQAMARHNILCYINCDILLPSTFVRALELVAKWREKFLMIGNRWDLNIKRPISFESRSWDEPIVKTATERGFRQSAEWVDYFVFRGDFLKNMPPFAVGRCAWDTWIVWNARARHIAVVDASSVVTAIHQNHDYSHHPQGDYGVRFGEEPRRNLAMAGGWRHLRTIADASHVIRDKTIQRTYRSLGVQARREMKHVLNVSHPIREKVGLTGSSIRRLLGNSVKSQFPMKRKDGDVDRGI